MAAFEPPTWQTPSRRQTKPVNPAEPEAWLDSRAARNRQRREASMERRFTWLFVAAVVIIALYLASRTPFGITLVHHFLTPTAR